MLLKSTVQPFEPAPAAVEIDGTTYPIDAGFRMGVRIETELLESDTPDIFALLTAFYRGNIPRNVAEAGKKMIWFFRGGEEAERKQNNGMERKKRVYDYRQDAGAITASFLSAYRIDLSSDDLHWWTFRNLLWELPVESPFMLRVKYRSADLKTLSKSQRKHYKKMQKVYAVKDLRIDKPKTAEEAEQAMLDKVARLYEKAEGANGAQ